jgi:hypothetical protein
VGHGADRQSDGSLDGPASEHALRTLNWHGQESPTGSNFKAIEPGSRSLIFSSTARSIASPPPTKRPPRSRAQPRYQQIATERQAARAAQAAPGPYQPAVKLQRGSLREAVAAYMTSGTDKLFKPQTDKQHCNHFKHILMTPASKGRHVLGESAAIDWLHGADAPDAVLRIMALCGDKAEQARRRLIALN